MSRWLSWVAAFAALGPIPVYPSEAGPTLRARLFDFESGVQGWSGNPWGGGKCGALPAKSAKFGNGCLQLWYSDVAKGATIGAPPFPGGLVWQNGAWAGLSLYVKGDGSTAQANLQLETEPTQGGVFSCSFPLESTEWRRFYFPFQSFWNRNGKELKPSHVRGLSFYGLGSHQFFVDEIQLETLHRDIPLSTLATVAIPPCARQPQIDGRLDDDCWDDAATLETFSTIDGSGQAKEQTRCRLLHQEGRLFIAARLETADVKRLKATLTRHDSEVYRDDSFEIFLTGDDPALRYFQFVVNPLGTTLDLSSKTLLAFEHDWKAATAVNPGEWVVEASIALSPLLARTGPGTTFAFNLGRENQVTGELSCWSPTGQSFLVPDRFGQAILLGSSTLLSLPAPTWIDYGDGVYAVRLDASSLHGKVDGVQLHTRFQAGTARFESHEAAMARDVADREIFSPLHAPVEHEGEARVLFSLRKLDGQPVSFHAFRHRLFAPPREAVQPRPELPILPLPKEITLDKGQFKIPRKVTLSEIGREPVDERVTRFLLHELSSSYGVHGPIKRPQARARVMLYKHKKGGPAEPAADLPLPWVERLNTLPAEGYLLFLSPSRMLLAANDDAGMYYGSQTFLQNVEQTTSGPDTAQARSCTVVDWPDAPWRALTLLLPTERWRHPVDAAVDVDFFCQFIERFVARHKFNAVVFVIGQGVRFSSHPELAGPAAWSKADLRKVVQTCRAHFIEPIPLVDSYGHAEWMTSSHPELAEDGDLHLACTSNPETIQIMTDIYSELLEVFAPTRFFHIGMDEVWWKTLDVSPEKRCTRCSGAPKWQLFAEHVKRLHRWLQEQGVTTMMWSDVLLPEHNGGAPYHGANALPLLPTDIIQTNWSTGLAPHSNRTLHDHGFTVWQSNSLGLNREQAEYCRGNMFGVWSKTPWWSDAPFAGTQACSYLNFFVSAEYSWNLWPELKNPQPVLRWSWLKQHEDGSLITDGQAPEPAGTTETFPIPIPGNLSSRASQPPTPDHWFDASPDRDLRNVPRGEVTLGKIRFHLSNAFQDCAWPTPPGLGRVVIPVGKKAASLRFLHAAVLMPGREEVFFEGFKKSQHWLGIPVGAYKILYKDANTENFPILYMNNIQDWRIGDSIPYVFGAVGYLFAATDAMRREDPKSLDICLTVAQWVNPHPQATIRSIEVTGCAEVVPVVFAITGRKVRWGWHEK